MRHKVAGKRLNRRASSRRGLRLNLIKQLFEHERIRTTRAKAEAIRPHAEKLITLAKHGNAADDPATMVHKRRVAAARLNDPDRHRDQPCREAGT